MAGSRSGSGPGSAGRGGDPGDGSQGDGSQGDGVARAERRGGGDARADPAATPLLAVVRGDASAEEIAALTAVLAARGGAAARLAAASAAARRGGGPFGWASRQALLRRPLSHGPGAWRASARPGTGA